MSMSFKSLVLDVDGVLIRDRDLLDHVRANCVRYVRQKLPKARNPERLNHLLYVRHGHTARGLQKCYKIDVSDFNHEVYDRQLNTHLWDVLAGTEFQHDAKHITSAMERGWRVTLFTNSPMTWASQVADAISKEVYVSCTDDTFVLKPDMNAYTDFAKHHVHLYVDDSVRNLETARLIPNWHPILFSPEGRQLDWCVTFGDIPSICEYTKMVD